MYMMYNKHQYSEELFDITGKQRRTVRNDGETPEN